MRPAIAACLLLLPFLGCTVRTQDLNRVRIEYSMANDYGGLGYNLTISGNGKVRYEGSGGVGVPGVQEYVIPQASAAAIVNVLDEAHFFSMPERVPNVVFDCAVIRIRYSDGRRQKLVIDNCRESIPKWKRGQTLADALRSKEQEPGLWEVSRELEHLSGADRFISSRLPDYALLTAEGWNLNTPGKSGWTALDYAASRRDTLSVAFLLNHGAAVSEHALIVASAVDDVRLLRVLLASSRASQDGLNRALDYAARSRNSAALELLLAAGADANGDQRWEAPIFGAVGSASGAAIDILVKHGANVNARDQQGRTPLIAAANGWDSGIVTQLVQLGAQIDARDGQDKTALMEAANRCYYWTMLPLLQAGAVPKSADLQKPPFDNLSRCAGEKAQKAVSLLRTAIERAQ